MTVYFRNELEELLKKHKMEDASNTSADILAEYLCMALSAFNRGVTQRNYAEAHGGLPKVQGGGA